MLSAGQHRSAERAFQNSATSRVHRESGTNTEGAADIVLGATMKLYTFILPALLLVLIPRSVWACSCEDAKSPCEQVWKSGPIFSGKVATVSQVLRPIQSVNPSNGKQQYTPKHLVHFVIENSWKESLPKEVDVETGIGGGDCGYPFKEGERYLVYG